MPKQPTEKRAQESGSHGMGPTWSAALQIAAAVAVGTALVAGPQLWAFGERLKADWRRWSTDQWPKSTAPASKAPAATRRPAVISAPVSDPAVKAAATKTPPRPVAQATPVQPSPKQAKASRVKPRSLEARTTGTTSIAPVLREQRRNPKVGHEIYMKQGIELYQAGWYGPAIGRFRLAAALIPSPTTYLWIGRAAIRAGRPFEARTALERTIALAPDSEAAREAHTLLDRLKSDKSSS